MRGPQPTNLRLDRSVRSAHGRGPGLALEGEDSDLKEIEHKFMTMTRNNSRKDNLCYVFVNLFISYRI